jgi:hypothetical protein
MLTFKNECFNLSLLTNKPKGEKMAYEIEVTDTFAGEANYSWVRKFKVQKDSVRGCILWLSKNYKNGWRIDYKTGEEFARYNLNGYTICCFIQWVEE